MKSIPRAYLVLFISFCSIQITHAQFNTVKYVSHGYFTGLNLDDSAIIEASFVITITQSKVEILKVDPYDPAKDQMYYESKTMSALKYPAGEGEGEFYYIWKLLGRKMVLRNRDGIKYLSLYEADEYGLPATYITFKLED